MAREICGCGRELVDGSCPQPDCGGRFDVGADPHGTYIRIFGLVCRGPRHEARRLVRSLDDELRAALADRLAVAAAMVREEQAIAIEPTRELPEISRPEGELTP